MDKQINWMKLFRLRTILGSILLVGASAVMAAPTGPFGTQVKNYAVPVDGNVMYVSPTGNGSGASLGDPSSIENAFSTATGGTTLIFRGGEYRSGGISYSTKLTLQPYLNEVPVLKGSEVATGWASNGGTWILTWDTLFPRSAPSHENGNESLWNYDMVIVDGTPLTQVELVSEVTSTKFHVDYDTDIVTIGTDPAGKTVEMTAHKTGLTRNAGTGINTDGGTIQGLTFTHYADKGFSFGTVSPSSAVEVNTGGAAIPNTRFYNNRFIYNGWGGARICGDDVLVKGNEFGYNGFLGLDFQDSNRGIFEENWVHHNNYQNIANYPAGIKVFNQCSEIMVRNNSVEYNKSNGIWMDVGITDSAIVHNLLKNNGKAQIHFEISTGVVIAGNVIIGDTGGDHGIFIQNGAYAHIYNNTIWGMRDAIGMKRNERDDDGSSIGWHALTGPGPGNYEHQVIANNLMANLRSGIAMVRAYETGDGIGADFDQPVDFMDYNGYFRPNSASPTVFVEWAPNPANYNSLGAFRSAYPQFEEHAIEQTGGTQPFFVNPPSDLQLKSGTSALGAGRPLPANVAAATGWPAGVAMDLGAYQSFTPPTVQSTYGNGGTPGSGATWGLNNDALRIEAENYDQGGEGIAYHDTTPGNTKAAYRSEDVDLEVTSDLGGGYNTGYTVMGEWLRYSLNVAEAGTYNVALRVARFHAGTSSVSVSFDGIDKTGLMSVPSTTNWQTFTTIDTSVYLDAGEQVMQVNMVGGSFNLNYIELTREVPVIKPYEADADTLQLWHFDEWSPIPNSAVSTNTHYPLVLSGAEADQSSLNGFRRAAQFSAATNKAHIGPLRPVSDFVGADGSFTYEALIKLDALPSTLGRVMQIVCMENEGSAARIFQFRITPAMELEFINVANGGSPAIAPLPSSGVHAVNTSDWFHVAVAYDAVSKNFTYYWTRLDPAAPVETAEVLLSSTMNNGLAMGTCDISVGNDDRTHSSALIGLIDEVRISGIARGAGDFLFPTFAADAGPDQTVVDEDLNRVESVMLDARLTTRGTDPISSYVWKENGTLIASGINPVVSLDIGTHLITLEVEDVAGRTRSDTVTVEVELSPLEVTSINLLTGWDVWTTASSIPATIVNGVIASASKGGTWTTPAIASCTDGTFGTLVSPAASTLSATGQGLSSTAVSNAINFTVSNPSEDSIQLYKFHFDAARRGGSWRYELEILEGSSITAGMLDTASLGVLWGSDFMDFDIDLQELPDATLEAGGTVTFQLRILDSGNRLDLDNVAITAATYLDPYVGVDTDNDQLPDDWEQEFFEGLGSTAEGDEDFDGLSNYGEYVAGTNPTNARSIFQVNSLTQDPGGFTLTWDSVSGRTYAVLKSAALTSNGSTGSPQVGWNSISAELPGTGFEMSYPDTASTGTNVFYQIQVTKP